MKSDSERTGGAAVAGAAPCYALRDTRIEMAGVMRCCLATVAEEYEGGDKGQDKTVTIGMKSKCSSECHPTRENRTTAPRRRRAGVGANNRNRASAIQCA